MTRTGYTIIGIGITADVWPEREREKYLFIYLLIYLLSVVNTHLFIGEIERKGAFICCVVNKCKHTKCLRNQIKRNMIIIFKL